MIYFLFLKYVFSVLADVAQWIECQPTNWKAAGSIRRQSTCLGCRPGPQLGCAKGNQSMYLSHADVSLPLFLSPSLPLSKNK